MLAGVRVDDRGCRIMNSLLNLLHPGVNRPACEILEELVLADAAAAIKEFKHRSSAIRRNRPLKPARPFRTFRERMQGITLCSQFHRLLWNRNLCFAAARHAGRSPASPY